MKLEKYGKIYRLGHKETIEIFSDPNDDIVVEEKIDGANFRFVVTEDEKIIFGTRNKTLGTVDDFAGGWETAAKFILDKLNKVDLDMLKSCVIFGECTRKHTINYDWDAIPPFLGFDIYKDGKYISNPCEIFESVGLPVVPVLYTCKVSELPDIDESCIKQSKYYDGLAEGIVFKNYEKQIFAKLVRERFKEENKEIFGGNCKNDDERLVDKYCTHPRIEKIVFKLVDNGNDLDMPLMQFLPKEVLADIYEENYSDILMSNYVLDLRNIRKLVSVRCKHVLSRMILDNNRVR